MSLCVGEPWLVVVGIADSLLCAVQVFLSVWNAWGAARFLLIQAQFNFWIVSCATVCLWLANTWPDFCLYRLRQNSSLRLGLMGCKLLRLDIVTLMKAGHNRAVDKVACVVLAHARKVWNWYRWIVKCTVNLLNLRTRWIRDSRRSGQLYRQIVILARAFTDSALRLHRRRRGWPIAELLLDLSHIDRLGAPM